MAMLGGECSECCGGWWCCPPVMKATLSCSFVDYETVVGSGTVFPGGTAFSRCLVNASHLNSIPSATYTLATGFLNCLTYSYFSPLAFSENEPHTWVRNIIVNPTSFGTIVAPITALVVLPARFTQLARSFSAFNCSDTPGGFGSGYLAADYEEGYTYGDIGYSNTGQAIFNAVVNQNSPMRQQLTSTTRYPASVSLQSNTATNLSWSLEYRDADLASCSYIGATQNSQILFPGSVYAGTMTIAATLEC